LIFLVAPCFGQEAQIHDFSGGLNTKAGIFGVKPNQATECLNTDPSEKYEALRPRKGYVSLTDSLPQATPVYGLYGAIDRDGSKRLVAVTDQRSSSLTGLGYLVASPDYDYEIDLDSGADSLYPYIYTGAPFSYTTWKDDEFISNGRQVPIVIHNGYARDLVVQAPGEPRIYPINDTAATGYGLENGEYRYLIIFAPGNGGNYNVSYLTHPVKSDSRGKVMLTNFTSRALDTLLDTTDGEWDSCRLSIYRCTTNVERYTKDIKMWSIFAVDLHPADSILDTLRIIDSVPDTLLGTGSYTGTEYPDYVKRGRLSNLNLNNFRVGAPTYIGRNISSDTNDICLPKDTAGDIDTTTICVAYMCTYTDTITGYESDSGRNLYVFLQIDTSGVDTVLDSNFVIGIPPVPAGSEYLVRNLYKAYGYTYARDSMGGNVLRGWDTTYIIKWGSRPIRGRWHATDRDTILTPIYALDTNFSPYYRLATIEDSTIKYYTDTNTWDSIMSQRDIYYRSGAPVALNYIVPFGDRAWGAEGSDVYYSYLDSGGYWSVFDNIALNKDDGDVITAIVPDRDYINIYKNNSKFILYTDDGINYNRKWIVDGIGCIAPYSMVSYNGNMIYLSSNGVISETGSIYKDKGSSVGIISFNIENLIDYTPDQQRTAVGAIKDNKYWLSYPDKDTTYVYDFKTGAWSIYDYAFSQATFYDTVHSDNIRPAKDMLFITSSSDKIFKADTGILDIDGSDSSAIYCNWTSGYIGMSPTIKTISEVGLYTEPDIVDSSNTVAIRIYDSWNNLRDSAIFTMQQPYEKKSPDRRELGNYFRVKVDNVSGSDTLAEFNINGIDIWIDGQTPVK